MHHAIAAFLLATVLTLAPAAGRAQQPDVAALLASEVEALRAFAMLDGVWRGPAMSLLPDGSWRKIVQTERIGPFLGGSIRVIEGRGYDDTGRVTFNAFGIVSYDPGKRSYTLRAHAQGLVGDFAFTPTGDGYTWEIPTGPGTLRYTATVKDGELHEVGDRIAPGREPLRVFDMRLKRIGDTDWPAAGAISPK